ncbi:DUF4232 domain-containing protein [Streptomyces sp. NPDC127190]|uniref:DUF4232 domain-containing protein n=1 Tax=unclassified Streptomyces TaxID=2593676 RepID=UPI00363E3479
MRATTRLTGALTALTTGLLLTACGTSATVSTTPSTTLTAEPATPLRACRTAALTWTLTVLGSAGPGRARLTAVNQGSTPCEFHGYPALEIHNGKADSIEGAGHGGGNALTLPERARRTVTVDLRYTRRGTKGADDWCVRQSEAVVRAPHDSGAATVPVTDTRHRSASIDACGQTLAMAPPRLTPAGS